MEMSKQAAAHWYQIDMGDGPHNLQGMTPYALTYQSTLVLTILIGSLMSHSAITTKGKPYIDAANYLRQSGSNVPFMLTETAGQIGGGAPDLGPTFGSTLWSVDWQMYCMSQGIARIAATMRPNAAHSLWIPIDDLEVQNHTGQAVRAPYYAQPFIADFIGTSKPGPNVIEQDMKDDHFTAYAAYEGNKLTRIALVDLLKWSPPNGTRPQRNVSISVNNGQKVRVARLAAEHGAYSGGVDFDGKNITYAGQQWSKKIDNGKGHPDQQAFETPDVKQGVLMVKMMASEAVIVHLD